LYCRRGEREIVRGLGFYAAHVPQWWRRPAVPDVRRALSANRTPALIIKGGCDYLSWDSAASYLDSFPVATLAYIADAGHEVHREKPEAFFAAVAAFLSGDAVPGRLSEPHVVPRGYQP
jgi:proline iminopeptidase